MYNNSLNGFAELMEVYVYSHECEPYCQVFKSMDSEVNWSQLDPSYDLSTWQVVEKVFKSSVPVCSILRNGEWELLKGTDTWGVWFSV